MYVTAAASQLGAKPQTSKVNEDIIQVRVNRFGQVEKPDDWQMVYRPRVEKKKKRKRKVVVSVIRADG